MPINLSTPMPSPINALPRRKTLVLSGIAACLLLLGGVFLAVRQVPPQPSPQQVVGRWHFLTTFQHGPRQGQQESGTIQFDQDQTLAIVLQDQPTVGYGRWWPAPEGHGLCYSFVEPVQWAGQFLLVSVTHFLPYSKLTLAPSKSFLSQGEGVAYPFPEKTAALPIMMVSQTTIQATAL